ncbi:MULTISPECIES: hypothetical protein [unclassified Sphingomonas]|uniref:hypothetical protein n=1 Tax=unclassified Sphingomonas TaxID=196159 RepID=UPI0006FE8555|nr:MULTISPECIES: hypothetical protein [unclassified Sphingomonas]KQM66990.1 nickel uptake transporter family protein [Sphingomonas sp. Leaf16]KQN17936.1 nickel uptake transporter family protein [Sphingomonas sp. Leaf29]KQN23800.1 nickel uptake transporter family protein [Sphingomonas sp. Leaf32]
MRRLAMMIAVAVPVTANAHEVWVERDGNGPARIYLGEPAEPMPVGGDPEFKNLTAPNIVGQAAVRQVRRSGYIEAQVAPGDVRVTDDSVFKPWGEAGAKEGVVYYARAGRSETGSRMAYEITPLTADADRFALRYNGKPVGGAKVTLVTPERRSIELTAAADGTITVPAESKGRYLLSAAQVETGRLRVAGGPVEKLHHIATTTFTVR